MIGTIRPAENDDLETSESIFKIRHLLKTKNDNSEACESMFQFGHILGCNEVKCVRALKCRSDEFFKNWPSFGSQLP